MLRIYNTLTRQKEEFKPIEPGKVRLYACGPTVYNYFHIGNARAFLTFDVVRRYLEYKGFEVTYVQNITDIEDKIIAQSIEEMQPFSEIAAKYTKAFLEDTKRLGLKQPTHKPKASEYIIKMIDFIRAQVEQGFAYESGGDVYFEVGKLPSYGQLSGKKTEDQKAGARVEENELKRHPADFTLWKASKPGEPSWDSPWGKGRPGWHTECVVMSADLLGLPFDIHGGGTDLMFPHHENELAQAVAVTGKPLANYWMHNGFLNIEGEKMSKSLKNFFTAREILDVYDAEAIRFFFLSKHYRSPIDFSRELMEESNTAVKNFYKTLSDLDWLNQDSGSIIIPGDYEKYRQEFTETMDDDFNTARALAVLFELNNLIRSDSSLQLEKLIYAKLLVELGSVLGFFQNLADKLSRTIAPELLKQIEALIDMRNAARRDRDWAASDRLRDELTALGVEVKDTKDGTVWKLI
jgi:cysteinyl-tRNA synthetase